MPLQREFALKAADAADTFSRLPREERLEWLSIFMTAQSPPDIQVIQDNVMQYTRYPADPVISASSFTQSLDSLHSLP